MTQMRNSGDGLNEKLSEINRVRNFSMIALALSLSAPSGNKCRIRPRPQQVLPADPDRPLLIQCC